LLLFLELGDATISLEHPHIIMTIYRGNCEDSAAVVRADKCSFL